MSLSDDWEQSALKSWFGNVAIASACAALGSPATVYTTLSTVSGGPGETGKANGSEMAYGGNGGRVGFLQSNGTNFTFQNSAPSDVRNGVTVTFGAMSSGSTETERAFLWTVGSSGATVVSFNGDLTTPLVMNLLVQPTGPAGSFIGTID